MVLKHCFIFNVIVLVSLVRTTKIKKGRFDVNDEDDKGLGLTLKNAEHYIVVPEEDEDQTDDKIVKLEKAEDLEDLSKNILNLYGKVGIDLDYQNVNELQQPCLTIDVTNCTLKNSSAMNNNYPLSSLQLHLMKFRYNRTEWSKHNEAIASRIKNAPLRDRAENLNRKHRGKHPGKTESDTPANSITMNDIILIVMVIIIAGLVFMLTFLFIIFYLLYRLRKKSQAPSSKNIKKNHLLEHLINNENGVSYKL